MKNNFIVILIIISMFIIGMTTGYIIRAIMENETHSQSEQVVLSLELKTSIHEYKPNESINITVKLINFGNISVKVEKFYYQSNLFFHLRNSTVYLTPKWYEFETVGTDQKLSPRENMSYNYNLRDYYENIPPSNYSLFVTYYSSGYNVYNTTLISNTITFTITSE